jgi:hypothetical protein
MEEYLKTMGINPEDFRDQMSKTGMPPTPPQ